MSYTMDGASFIDSINDRASEESKYINHIMRQGLIQFIALDYAILKAVRTLREDIGSIDKPYLLGNGNGNSQLSIGLPILASLELNSLFDKNNPANGDEIRKFKNLARILYRINAQKFDWIDPDDESWIAVSEPFPVDVYPKELEIVSHRDPTQPHMAITINDRPNPKIKIARYDIWDEDNNADNLKETGSIMIPLQEKTVQEKVSNGKIKIYAFTAEIYEDLKIADAYTKYRISQLLQSIWSYPLLYPTVFYQLSPNYKDITQIADNLPEQSDPHVLKRVEEAKSNTRVLEFLNNLENANSGIPVQDEVKEILKNIVQRVGNIPIPVNHGNRYEDIAISDPRYDDYEDNNELKIVDDLMLNRTPRITPPKVEVDDPDADDIIRKVGLEDIFHQLFDLVQDDSSSGFNLEVFNSIRDLWGRLFSVSAGTPDGINYIEKQLPSIEGSFRNIIPSRNHQDYFAKELDKVLDFLRGAINQDRLTELRDILNNPSPSMFINTFRSLNGLDSPVLDPLPPLPPELRPSPSTGTAESYDGATITLKPTYGPSGTVVHITGTGFAVTSPTSSSTDLTITYGGTPIQGTPPPPPPPIKTDIHGNFKVSFTVPEEAARGVIIEAKNSTTDSEGGTVEFSSSKWFISDSHFWRIYDQNQRFDYLFIIWWILTYDKLFKEIAAFASARIPEKYDNPQGGKYTVNFDAMFPGSLGGPSIVLAGGPSQLIDQSNSSARLELEYATYERNLSSLDNQLRKPGGLIRLARSYGGLPI